MVRNHTLRCAAACGLRLQRPGCGRHADGPSLGKSSQSDALSGNEDWLSVGSNRPGDAHERVVSLLRSIAARPNGGMVELLAFLVNSDIRPVERTRLMEFAGESMETP